MIWLLTIQPARIMLFRAYSWARTHGTEQSGVSAHEIHVYSSIQCAIWGEEEIHRAPNQGYAVVPIHVYPRESFSKGSWQ